MDVLYMNTNPFIYEWQLVFNINFKCATKTQCVNIQEMIKEHLESQCFFNEDIFKIEYNTFRYYL